MRPYHVTNLGTFSLLFLALVSGEAAAATNIACVGNAADLTAAFAALPTSTTSSDATDIRLRVGTYLSPSGGWAAAVTDHHDLGVHGGYLDAACEQRTFDASQTVLDAHRTGTVLAIAALGIPSSSIEVSGLTFQNGNGSPMPAASLTAGGLQIGDPGPISGGSVLVERNIFRGNVTSSPGAGALVAATDGASFVVRGNLFAGNSAATVAAASVYSNNAIDVSNNTFVDNQATDTSASQRVVLDFFTFGGLKLDNNIFWNNTAAANAFDIDLGGQASGASAVDNDIQTKTGTAVEEIGTLHLDPVFVAPGNFRLRSSSPLIGAGANSPPGGIADRDLDGAQRIAGAAIDLGAYENGAGIFRNGFEIGGFVSGNWYNTAQSGHGFQLEATASGEMVAIWFAFAPDGGAQSWIYAQGAYDRHANSVTLPAVILAGARFPPNFRAADVHPSEWGTITFTFADCDKAQVSWHSVLAGYDQANDTQLAITRLTQIAGTACPS